MKKLLLLAIFPLWLSGCATMLGPPPMPGDTAEVVQAKFGQPTGAYKDGDDTLLEYARGPLGSTRTWRVSVPTAGCAPSRRC